MLKRIFFYKHSHSHAHRQPSKFRTTVHYSVSNCVDIFELGIKSFDLQMLKLLPQKSEPVTGCNMAMSTYNDLRIVLISLDFTRFEFQLEKDKKKHFILIYPEIRHYN